MATSTIIRLAIRALNHPAARSLAKQVMGLLKKEGPENKKKLSKLGLQLRRYFNKTARKAENLMSETISPTADVNVRRQLFYNKYGQGQKAGKGYFADFKKTPMIDIDLPGPHPDSSIVWSSEGEAMKAINKYLKTAVGKDSLFKLYRTPGGLRLFDLARRRSPRQYYDPRRASGWLQHQLGEDPWYSWHNLKRGAFASRVGPKPGRKDDYVAKFIDYVGEGEPNPKNFMDVKLYHDDLIRRIMENSTKSEASMGGWFDILGRAAYTK